MLTTRATHLWYLYLGEVIFDWRRSKHAPDFIFGEDDKDFNPDSEKLEVMNF